MLPAADRSRAQRDSGALVQVARESAPVDRARLAVVPPDTRAADQLAHTMRLVKAARFNAATRLERKAAVSLFTQSMVALYFVGLAVWQAVYVGQIDDATNRLMTFVQLVSSVFTLILGLLEAMNDYKMKAHHLQNCALAVSELAQELRIARPSDPQDVQAYRRRYNEALRACPVNHARIDFLFAKLDGSKDRAQSVVLSLRYALDVYGLYVLFLAVPPLIWWVHQ
ncbi:SLATT domain-containing protein [uncultured Hyphomicrobium sp.]|uniref:SLATT domain-containing protein n=1 Tax=uncultured Hyphomicrobium sp. TaxID=194373 RepID=UPI0025EC5A5A|nr:SLATT domain-containing protein [uncultured Hyphomicrobium sp.]